VNERQRRIGLNEAVFRDVNERIEELAETFGLGDRSLDLVCECGDASCTERIAMPMAEYEEMRSGATLFAVYPGHEAPDVESIIERREGYDLIRKHEPEPANLARETDPRA
jgi:hypothetical protein